MRSRLFYGIEEKLGITYTYDYNVKYADRAYENRFFGELSRLAKPAPLTAFQRQYNDQDGNVLDVADNHHIDAPSVERWLATHPPAGVDTRRNTVFFINWYGRSDFKFHVYTKTDEPDPDTGYNFGVQRDSRKIIAWGGTTADDEENGLGSTRRVWFHDLSAGPESWTANWNVDDPDLDGNGVEDYRMPAIWEYAAGGYRAPGGAHRRPGEDHPVRRAEPAVHHLAAVPGGAADARAADARSTSTATRTRAGPASTPRRQYIKPGLLLAGAARAALDATRSTTTARTCRSTVRPSAATSRSWSTTSPATPSWATRRSRTSSCRTRSSWRGPRTTRAGSTTSCRSSTTRVGEGVPVAGARASPTTTTRDGTQSYVFAFVSPEIVEAGYGLTTTLIHEVGHHVGMSHPHDGYDSTSGVDYGPADEFFFAWAGDESNSMMSYIDLNWDFSQFDRDNSDRFLAAAYNEAANRLAAEVLADPDAGAGAATSCRRPTG